MKTRSSLVVVLLIVLVVGCGRDPMEPGWEAFRRGDLDAARAHFEALAKEPRFRAEAEANLGELALYAGDYEQAASHYANARAARPDFALAIVGVGEALLRQGKDREAFSTFLEALALSTEPEIVRRIAGLVGDAHPTRRLTRSKTDNYGPRFTPDGKSIVFTTHWEGSGEIMRLSLDTLAVERLVEMPMTNEYGAQFTPDGRWLLFSSVQHRTNAGMIMLHASGSSARSEMFYLRDMETGVDRKLTTSPSPVGNPYLRPDAQQIAFEAIVEGNLDIWTMDMEGKNRRRLTEGEEDDGEPVYSPDGKTIVFVQTQDANFELMAMDADGSNVRQVTFTQANEYSGMFSPDGTRFVFARRASGSLELAMMDWKTRRSWTLSRGRADSIQPAFSPDGTQIVFASNRSDYLELYVMDLTKEVNPETLERQLRARIARER